MLILFVILVVFFSVVLGLIVLIQNPKGGGLTGSLGGFSNQLIGVKQSTDIMEKGTWIFAALVAIMCITSAFFIKNAKSSRNLLDDAPVNAPKNNTPQKTATPMPGTQQNASGAKPADSLKK